MSAAELACGEPVTDKRLIAALQKECLALARQQHGEGAFPGSQPVSFERKHLDKALHAKPYYACEKTDGVRYMLLASQQGAFMVDRKFNLRRVRVHLPRRDNPAAQVSGTLLDGELVEDVEKESGARTLRYLVYDAVCVHGRLLLGESLPMRLLHVHKFVLAPRAADRSHDYAAEPFTLELKQFYSMADLRFVFERVIPDLEHENDGIIFTPVAEPYVPGTCHTLLKWKPAHMNTVDFKLITVYRTREPRYQLGAGRNGVTVPHAWLDVTDEERQQLRGLDGRIIECWYDHEWHTTKYADGRDWSYSVTEPGGWRYMRPREDKHTPNDEGVIAKVIRSIQDNVRQDELLAAIEGGDEPVDGAPPAAHAGPGAADADRGPASAPAAAPSPRDDRATLDRPGANGGGNELADGAAIDGDLPTRRSMPTTDRR